MQQKWFVPKIHISKLIFHFHLFYSCFLDYDNLYVLEQASMEREVELEHRSIEASTALARIQVM